MSTTFRAYKILNLLSIDVAAGAVSAALFFAAILSVHVRAYGFICLGLTVWVVYTADHLYDAWVLKTSASTPRHLFHQQHFRLLTFFVLVAAMLDLMLAFLIKDRVFHFGMILGGIVFVYFLVQSRLKFAKEITGAVLYSAGILLPSVAVTEKHVSLFVIVLIAQFFLTALINLILFSWFDYRRDLQDGRSSLITLMGDSTGKILLWILFLTQAAFTAYLWIRMIDPVATLVLAAMNLVLWVIFMNGNYFSIRDRYRLAGDAVFFLPTLYFLFAV
jgi:4-hydroxybenzoate polyprenyltransferase